MKLYHYTSDKFENFDVEKCDGIWLTDIAPSDEEMLQEIGADGLNWVAVCEADTNNALVNGDNYDVDEQLKDSEFGCIENIYDGFTDYAFSDTKKVKIIEWIEI